MEREIPNGEIHRPLADAVWDFALYGIPRSTGFRAEWDFAPYGMSRRICAPLCGLPNKLPHSDQNARGNQRTICPYARSQLLRARSNFRPEARAQ